MAIKIYDKFAPRANVGDTNYPNGSIKNESVPGAKDGTPLDAVWGNDYAGFDAALLAEAGITPSGLADTALVSQRLDAIKNMIDTISVVSTGSSTARRLTERFTDILNVEDWGVSILSLDNTAALQAAIDSNPGTLLIDRAYLTKGLDFSNFTGKVRGRGELVGTLPTTPNDVLINMNRAVKLNWEGVTVNCGQTPTTVASDNKYRYGWLIHNCVGLNFKYAVVTGIRIGYPLFVSGTSAVGIDKTTNGSKRIRFSNCDFLAYPDPTPDQGAQIIVKSDFYEGTGGGAHVAGSNGVKTSDYTVDVAVSFPQTTEKVFFTDCTVDSCDRVGVLNAKKVFFDDNILTGMNKRGVSASPTCDSVHINGGSIEGGISACINFTLATTNCSVNGVDVDPVGFDSLSGEASALRVLQGCSHIAFSNITGRAGRLRAVWVLGSSDVTLDNVTLLEHLSGTENALDITAGLGGNTVAYTMARVFVKNSKFTAKNGLLFNSTTGLSDYDVGALRAKSNTFTVTDSAVSSPFTSSPTIQDRIDLVSNDFFGAGAAVEVNFRTALHARIARGNVFGVGGSATEGFATRKYSSLTSPDNVPYGTSVVIADGTDSGLPGTSKLGTLSTLRPWGIGANRSFTVQHFYTNAYDTGSELGRVYFRKALLASDTWSAWRTLQSV